MNCRIDDVMGLCCKISENRKIKATVQNSAKGGVTAGGGAFIGGLLGGPPGIFLGATIGGALGWWMTSGRFQPLHQIIIELPPRQKKKLYDDVMAVLGKLDWIDLAQLLVLVMGNSSLQMHVLSTILSFATKELGAKVQYED
ncbi:Protein C19orf12 -like protein [Triplophysa tibetana]|uniref:Protein C19orf12-like protein n=1 Tax=Triplophysa tibetana TaxID=1572043 RepID=A0A5A9PS26_9TELE|nr:Protein C19orf12 -like protein [Triplophysa tibetana]